MDIFFVKRNAAYEMRISDWSSDLCSSDLLDCRRHEHGRVVDGQILDVLRETLGELVHAGGDLLRNGDGVGAGRLVDADSGAGLAVEASEDRKSVVEGKRVSVRVDLGGRRVLKQTTLHTPPQYH